MIKNIRNRINGTLKPSIQGILLYSVLWGLCVLVLMRIFNVNGKTFLYLQDGAYQHFISFNYLCDYIKELIYNQKSVFFDFTLGQGMDILTTLNCYDFTDPISILCTLLLPLNRVGRYTVMIFVKLYLVGFSFLFYCHSIEKNSPISTATAALAYAFSGAVLFSFARHPNYINWAYFLPFILGGG